MKLYSENKNYKLYKGSMLNMLEVIEKGSVDSVITDPPYELNFMGKGWDNAGISFQADTWKKCFDVLKPGGYLLAFGGSRTFHRIACAIEDAGFEIRDTIMWLYGSGFPKSMDIEKSLNKRGGLEQVGESSERAKQWQGWGTALKPSFEPIIVARKPFKSSLVDNVIEYGVGGINIDECRVETTKEDCKKVNRLNVKDKKYNTGMFHSGVGSDISNGRFPANTILTYDETDYDEVCGGFPNTKSQIGARGGQGFHNCLGRPDRERKDGNNLSGYEDSGSASRYFYCAKASKKDRDEGLDEFEEKNTMCDRNPELASANMPQNRSGNLRKNTHPTVKPTTLMQYLVRLVTPNGGTILDPFNGSGSTGKAVMYENKERNKNYKYIGIELTEEYLPIAKARIEYVCKDKNLIENLKESAEKLIEGQTNIFDFIGDGLKDSDKE